MKYPVSLKVSYKTDELDGDVINSVKSTHVLECRNDVHVLCKFLNIIGNRIYHYHDVRQIVDVLEQRVSNHVIDKELYFSLF